MTGAEIQALAATVTEGSVWENRATRTVGTVIGVDYVEELQERQVSIRFTSGVHRFNLWDHYFVQVYKPFGEVRASPPPNPLKPKPALLCKLGSIIVHTQESRGPHGHEFDVVALRTLLDDPEVIAWMGAMNALAMLPLPRNKR